MKRLTFTLALVVLVSAGCARRVTTGTTELVRISEEKPRTVRGQTWDAPYCAENARFDRVRVTQYSTRGLAGDYVVGGLLAAFGLLLEVVVLTDPDGTTGSIGGDMLLGAPFLLTGAGMLTHGIWVKSTEPATTREVEATDVFGLFSSAKCPSTPPLPVARAFYCGDFDPSSEVSTDDASRYAEEMCLQPIDNDCGATRDLACRAATLLLSDLPQSRGITFEAKTPEGRMLELVNRHLSHIDAFELVRATPLAGDAQADAVSMVGAVAARRYAPAVGDALARLLAEVDAETGERGLILREMHGQAAQIAALTLSRWRGETESEAQLVEQRRALNGQVDRIVRLPPPPGPAEPAEVLATSSGTQPEFDRSEGTKSATREESTQAPIVAPKPALLPRGSDPPAYAPVDWSGEVQQKLSEAECPGPVLIRPASLAGDELRAVELLRWTFSSTGREIATGSSAENHCVLLVHSPRQTAGVWSWQIDVQGTQLRRVDLHKAGPPYLLPGKQNDPRVWDPATQTVVRGKEAYALLNPGVASTKRLKRTQRSVLVGVVVGAGVLGTAATVGLVYIIYSLVRGLTSGPRICFVCAPL